MVLLIAGGGVWRLVQQQDSSEPDPAKERPVPDTRGLSASLPETAAPREGLSFMPTKKASSENNSHQSPVLPSDPAPTDASIENTPREEALRLENLLRADRAVLRYLEECADLAMARDPALRGLLVVSYGMDKDETVGSYVLTLEIDEKGTSIEDKALLDCATANPFAVEGLVEDLGDLESFSAKAGMEFPPSDKVQDWPPDDSSPVCDEGGQLVGEPGVAQWCERLGLRQGAHYQWYEGELEIIRTFHEGELSTAEIRQ